jgi:hypothetical protein
MRRRVLEALLASNLVTAVMEGIGPHPTFVSRRLVLDAIRLRYDLTANTRASIPPRLTEKVKARSSRHCSGSRGAKDTPRVGGAR